MQTEKQKLQQREVEDGAKPRHKNRAAMQPESVYYAELPEEMIEKQCPKCHRLYLTLDHKEGCPWCSEVKYEDK